MKLALFLLTLGFGYKIYADASVNSKKRIKQLGQVVGAGMMILSILGSLMAVGCFMGGMKYCPITGKRLNGAKFFCPLSSQGSLLETSQTDQK